MERHPDVAGVMLAAKEDLVPLIESTAGGGLPRGLQLRTGELEGLIDWADLALNTSGTVSLDLARQGCPMVAVYKIGLFSFIGSKAILTMPDRLLPNIVAGRRIVPEFVPYVGGHRPIVEAADELLSNPQRLAQVRSDLADVVARFGDHDPDRESVDAIDHLLADSN
jgi:lipid-A-disaccharide synthase